METKTVDRDIEGLKHAENIWARSLTEGNPKLLATIIDEPFSFIGPDGQLERRDDYLAGYEALEKMQVKVASIDMDQIDYRVIGDVGIVTGHVLAKVEMQGQPMTEDVRFTRVYRRGEGGWKLVAGQGTRIAEGPPLGAE
ncbi:MAG: nuclear transport factor 2 family protein [Polyangiaceae bacterium]|nr:nuclear transport factor 2 family protein [Polyangiaceae bacterium]